MFVGVERIRAVRYLTEAWLAAETQHIMRLVLVEGPTGIGKTALAQALYEQLAMLQARPAYWPATLDTAAPPGIRNLGAEAVGVADAPGEDSAQQNAAVRRLARADLVYPVEMAPANGSRPGFFWWGLTGQKGGFATLAGEPQIKRHVAGIAEAVARADHLARDRFVAAAKTAGVVAALGALGPVLAGAAANVDASRHLIDLLTSIPELARSRASLLEVALRRNSGTVFSVNAQQEALEGAEADARVLGLIARELPFVIAVEKAQFLDPVTIELLRSLSHQPSSAGLIILMVDTDQAYTGVSDRALGDWLSSEERLARLTRIQLDALSAGEVTEIAVRELGSELDTGMLARVVDHAAGVPGILYSLLESRAVAHALRDGAAGPADFAALPDLAGVSAALADLPAATRQAVVAASVHGLVTLRKWLASPGAQPRISLKGKRLEVADNAVDDAIAAGWLQQRRGEGTIEFTSSHVLHVAQAEQSRELTPAMIRAEREALLAGVVTAHADRSWDDLDQDVRESVLASVIGQESRTMPDLVRADLTAELFSLRRVSNHAAAAAELLATVGERLHSGRSLPGVLIVATAEALFDEGRRDEAFQLLREEYDRLQNMYGDTDTQTLSALHNLAAVYAGAARAADGTVEAEELYQNALSRYSDLLRLREANLPAAHELIISTRSQYAELLAACYLYQDAISQGEILLGEQRSVLGPDNHATLRTRNELAEWRVESGDIEGAVADFRDLLPDMMRALGSYHSLTLAVRNNLATAIGEAGDRLAAIAALQELLADLILVLGSDHPLTLNIRNNLASEKGAAGDLIGAAVAYGDLVADKLRTLDPDDPNTLTTRSNWAHWLGEAGKPASAAARLQELLPDLIRILGPDHPFTLTNRNDLAEWRGQAGDRIGAVTTLQELLPDLVRALGPDHPDTLKTRAFLAHWRSEAESPGRAAAAYAELVLDQSRILGPYHVDTLITGINLAENQGLAGDPVRAAAGYAELLPHLARVLGPDHPDTLLARKRTAYWQRVARSPGRGGAPWAGGGNSKHAGSHKRKPKRR